MAKALPLPLLKAEGSAGPSCKGAKARAAPAQLQCHGGSCEHASMLLQAVGEVCGVDFSDGLNFHVYLDQHAAVFSFVHAYLSALASVNFVQVA